MPRRTPQKTHHRDVDEDGDSQLSISSDDGSEEEEEEEEEDPDDDDRGDDHDPDPDNDDEGDGSEEEEEEDPDEGEDGDEGDDPDADEDENEDADVDEDTLREIGVDESVPRARLNEVLEELRQLREKVGGGASAASHAPAFDLKAKQKERNEKLLEGDIDAASTIDDEIAEYHSTRAAEAAASAAQQAIQQEKVADAIVEIQRDYPVLNDKKKAFDRDTLDEVVALRNVYMNRGERMDAALRKAAKRICERVPARGEEERTPRDKGKKTPAMTLRQKRDAMKAARRTPPSLSRHGASGRPALSVDDMSEEALARMPDAKFSKIDRRDKAAMRGDFVEPRGKARK